MASMQQFVRWVKQKRSKKNKDTHAPITSTKTVDDTYGLAQIQVTHNGVVCTACAEIQKSPAYRKSSCRACMKLPAIPKLPPTPDISRTHGCSPAHIYEEIPAFDPEHPMHCNTDAFVDIDNLDFGKAKEFGPYLVVPLRDRSHNGLCFVSNDVHQGRYLAKVPGKIPDHDVPCSVSDIDSGVYFASVSSENYIHCKKCNKPQGLNEGESFPHLCDKDSLRYLDLATLGARRSNSDNLSETNLKDADHVRSRSNVGALDLQQQHKTSSNTDLCLDYDMNTSAGSSLGTNSSGHGTLSSESSFYLKSPESGDWSCDLKAVVSGGSSCNSYSEYDIKSDESLPGGMDDYEYYLSKVQRNRLLEEDVQRIKHSNKNKISKQPANTKEDNMSLTSVTSMSELSSWDEGEVCTVPSLDRRSAFRQCKKVPRTHQRNAIPHQKSHRISSKKTVTFSDSDDALSLYTVSDTDVSGVKTKHSRGKLEYYRLPGMSSNCHCGRGSLSCKCPQSGLKPDSPERLSCRVTDYKPLTASRKLAMKPQRPLVSAQRTQYTAGYNNGTNQNRLLTDLMRINHDRQLLYL